MADRQDFKLRKSGRHDPLAIDFDKYYLVHIDSGDMIGLDTRGRASMSLDGVEAFLTRGRE